MPPSSKADPEVSLGNMRSASQIDDMIAWFIVSSVGCYTLYLVSLGIILTVLLAISFIGIPVLVEAIG